MVETCRENCPLVLQCSEIEEIDARIQRHNERIEQIGLEAQVIRAGLSEVLSKQAELLAKTKKFEDTVASMLEETDALEEILELSELQTLTSNTLDRAKLDVDATFDQFSRVGAMIKPKTTEPEQTNYGDVAAALMRGCKGSVMQRKWLVAGKKIQVCRSPNLKEVGKVLDQDTTAETEVATVEDGGLAGG